MKRMQAAVRAAEDIMRTQTHPNPSQTGVPKTHNIERSRFTARYLPVSDALFDFPINFATLDFDEEREKEDKDEGRDDEDSSSSSRRCSRPRKRNRQRLRQWLLKDRR